MREIITWLRTVEELAGNSYREAAEFFQEDKEFASFLVGMAEDEALHYHLMGSAAALFEEQGAFPPGAIQLDASTRDRVEAPLRRCAEQVRAGKATKTEIIIDLVEAEHSEWNDIFIYVIRECQGQSRAFQRVAATVNAHGKKVDAWKDALPQKERAAISAGTLPRLWQPRFLVVEDDASLRELFGKILADLGEVVTATNGEEGLCEAKRGFFDVIISDQDMPIMTGMELFRLGKELDPHLGQHFILCTGNASGDIRLFCKEEGVKLLEKPVSLTRLRDSILDVVGSPSSEAATA